MEDLLGLKQHASSGKICTTGKPWVFQVHVGQGRSRTSLSFFSCPRKERADGKDNTETSQCLTLGG